MARIENTINIDGGDFGELKLWTGRGRLSFGGAEWIGASRADGRGFLELSNSHVETVGGATAGAMQMRVALTAAGARDPWLQDPRRVLVTIGWIVQASDTGVWTSLDHEFAGYMSAPRYGNDGVLVVDIVPRIDLIDEGDPLRWDRGRGLAFGYLEDLQAGVDIRWPP